MKIKYFFILLTGAACFVSATAQAQSTMPVVLASAGNDFSAGGYTVSFTAGEMSAIETFSSAGNILTQGFHQPDITGVSVHEWSIAPVHVDLFPNPASDFFAIRFQLDESCELRTELLDALGRNINEASVLQCQPGESMLTLEVPNSASGVYLFKMTFISSTGQTAVRTQTISFIR